MTARILNMTLVATTMALVVSAGGCAVISKSTHVDRTLESTNPLPPAKTSTPTLDGCKLNGSDLTCSVVLENTCVSREELVYSRVQTNRKEWSGWGFSNTSNQAHGRSIAMIFNWSLTALGVGLSAGGAALAGIGGEWCSQDSGTGEPDCLSNTNVGLGMLIPGVLLLVPPIVDAFRAIDTSTDIDDEKETREVGASYDCGIEPGRDVPVVLTFWNGGKESVQTDMHGRATIKLSRELLVIPENEDVDWARVSVAGEEEKSFNPTAAEFASMVTGTNSLEQYERYRARLPNSSEWKNLEPRFQKLLAEQEAEHQRKLEEQKRATEQALQAKREEWRKAAQAALDEAKRLDKNGRLSEAYDVLTKVGEVKDEPLAEKVLAARKSAFKRLTLQHLKLRPLDIEVEEGKDPYEFFLFMLRYDIERLREWGENDLAQKVEVRLGELEVENQLTKWMGEISEYRYQEMDAYVTVQAKKSTLVVSMKMFESDDGRLEAAFTNIYGAMMKRRVSRKTIFDTTMMGIAVRTADMLSAIADRRQQPGQMADPQALEHVPALMRGVKNVSIDLELLLPQYGHDKYANRYMKKPKRLRTGELRFSVKRLLRNDWESIGAMIEGGTFQYGAARLALQKYVSSWKTR